MESRGGTEPVTDATGQSSADSASDTFFLPAARAARADVAQQAGALAWHACWPHLLEAMPTPAVVLNAERQILAANARFLATVEAHALADVLGLRVGEALRCIRVAEGPAGCGTSPHCVTCGAAQATAFAQQTLRCAARECRVTVRRHGRESLEFEALATPLEHAGHRYLVLALRDISAERRRAVLEQVFLHDVLNTAGALRGLAELLRIAPDAVELSTLGTLADQLVQELSVQRAMAEAERSTYVPTLAPMAVWPTIHEVLETYRRHPAFVGRDLVATGAPASFVVTDAVLFRRVLGNLVKNALEATPLGGLVQVIAAQEDGALVLAVRNDALMPPAVQSQLFQRSFSTKSGLGRGLGLYGVRLFVERVLGGSVQWSSTPADGTTFRVVLPRVATDGASVASGPGAGSRAAPAA